MNTIVQTNSLEDDRFKTISEFQWCLKRGGEVQFDWDNKTYGIIHHNGKIIISELYNEETEKWYDTPEEVLTYPIGDTLLKNIITKVNVTSRTF